MLGIASLLAYSDGVTAGSAPPTTADTTTTSEPSPPPTTEPPPPPTTADGPFTDLGQVGAESPDRGTQLQTKQPPPPPSTIPAWKLAPANSGWGRRVVYSKTFQRVWVVDESGTTIKTHLVSGRQTPLDPRPGTYSVWSRSRHTYSISNPTVRWGYMVRFAKGARGGNIGFHEIPNQYGRPVQTIAQLGQPLSGGCVRQAVWDAIWMWNWAQIGTKVVVLP
jgi:hypothetical protein